MAEHSESDSKGESFMDTIVEKLHSDDSSSSSFESDSDKNPKSSVKTKIFRLFGREKPLHKVFGGGKPKVPAERVTTLERDLSNAADIFLWRNKKISAGVLVGATAIWILFELVEYHLLTLVCHILILLLATLFLWSNATTFIKKSSPHIPEVQLPEEPFLEVASALRIEINRALAVLRDIASGKDLKKFLGVVVGLWISSILGSCCNFLTLLYISVVLLHTVPVLYEKYGDQVDSLSEKAMIEIKKQYAVFDSKVLSKIPRGPLKDKKRA